MNANGLLAHALGATLPNMGNLFSDLRQRAVLLTWFALTAICLQLVAGVIGTAHATQPLVRDGAIEICTANGIRWINTKGESQPVPSHKHSASHCPFCASGHGGNVPIAASGFQQLPVSAFAEPALMPVHDTQQPTRTVFQASPRAPPQA